MERPKLKLVFYIFVTIPDNSEGSALLINIAMNHRASFLQRATQAQPSYRASECSFYSFLGNKTHHSINSAVLHFRATKKCSECTWIGNLGKKQSEISALVIRSTSLRAAISVGISFRSFLFFSRSFPNHDRQAGWLNTII